MELKMQLKNWMQEPRRKSQKVQQNQVGLQVPPVHTQMQGSDEQPEQQIVNAGLQSDPLRDAVSHKGYYRP